VPDHVDAKAVDALGPAARLFTVRAMLVKRQRIPLTALSGKEIASVNVDCAGQPIDRIDVGMNDVGGLIPMARPAF
jgi:hypothetical protein